MADGGRVRVVVLDGWRVEVREMMRTPVSFSTASLSLYSFPFTVRPASTASSAPYTSVGRVTMPAATDAVGWKGASRKGEPYLTKAAPDAETRASLVRKTGSMRFTSGPSGGGGGGGEEEGEARSPRPLG